MPLLLLVLPALVAQAPAPTAKSVDRVQELFKAIPEAFIEGKRGAKRAWWPRARWAGSRRGRSC